MKTLAALLCAAALTVPTFAAPAKPAAKTVTVYKADKCGMLFTTAQAKKYHYACPDSKGKMTKVAVPAAVAKAGLAQTVKALPPGPQPPIMGEQELLLTPLPYREGMGWVST